LRVNELAHPVCLGSGLRFVSTPRPAHPLPTISRTPALTKTEFPRLNQVPASSPPGAALPNGPSPLACPGALFPRWALPAAFFSMKHLCVPPGHPRRTATFRSLRHGLTSLNRHAVFPGTQDGPLYSLSGVDHCVSRRIISFRRRRSIRGIGAFAKFVLILLGRWVSPHAGHIFLRVGLVFISYRFFSKDCSVIWLSLFSHR